MEATTVALPDSFNMCWPNIKSKLTYEVLDAQQQYKKVSRHEVLAAQEPIIRSGIYFTQPYDLPDLSVTPLK